MSCYFNLAYIILFFIGQATADDIATTTDAPTNIGTTSTVPGTTAPLALTSSLQTTAALTAATTYVMNFQVTTTYASTNISSITTAPGTTTQGVTSSLKSTALPAAYTTFTTNATTQSPTTTLPPPGICLTDPVLKNRSAATFDGNLFKFQYPTEYKYAIKQWCPPIIPTAGGSFEYKLCTNTKARAITQADLLGCQYLNKTKYRSPQIPTASLLAVQMNSIIELNTAEQSMTFSGAIWLQWVFFTLCRRADIVPDQNDVQTKLALTDPKSDLWEAPLILLNSVNDVEMTSSRIAKKFVAIICNDFPYRTITFYQTRVGVFKTRCDFDVADFFADSQICEIIFAIKMSQDFATFDSMYPYNTDNGRQFGQLSNNSVWQTYDVKLVLDTLYMPTLGTNISIAKYVLKFSRQTGFYLYYLVIPSLALTSLNAFSFLMHPLRPDRPIFVVLSLLAVFVNLNWVTSQIPETPKQVPVGRFLFKLVVFSATCAVYNAFTCGLSHAVQYSRFDARRKRWKICRNKVIIIDAMRLLDLIGVLLGIGYLGAVCAYYYVAYIVNRKLK